MATSIRWSVPEPLNADEVQVARDLQRIGKFYVFLRTIRHELFDEAFQAELAAGYQPRGTAPVPPALLAMVLLLQAYDQVGDAEAVVSADITRNASGLLAALDITIEGHEPMTMRAGTSVGFWAPMGIERRGPTLAAYEECIPLDAGRAGRGTAVVEHGILRRLS